MIHPQYVILIPLVGAAAIVAAARHPNVRETITLVTACSLILAVLSYVPLVLAPGFWIETWPHAVFEPFEMVSGLPVAFHVEPLGLCFALIASILWLINSLYAIGYVRANRLRMQTRFYTWIALSIFSVMGVAFAGNFLTLFIFYECLTLATFPLVAHSGTPGAIAAARTYLGTLVLTSSSFLLIALIGTYTLAGDVAFVPQGVMADYVHLGRSEATLVLGLFIFAVLGINKAALMPFHRWLPGAMVAPTPVSALLHAVAVVKTGVFSILKISLYLFGPELLLSRGFTDWLVYLACFTTLSASLVALFQDNLKRRLAYSTIGQLAYIVLATALLARWSVMAAVLHMVAHALGKITLFFVVGAIYTKTRKTEVSQLNGIGRTMPWTMIAFGFGALGMIGLPPTFGFISKWYLLSGAIAAGSWLVVWVLIISTLLNAAYFLPILYRAFFLAPESVSRPLARVHWDKNEEAPRTMLIAIGLTSGLNILLFFVPGVVVTLAEQLSRGVFLP